MTKIGWVFNYYLGACARNRGLPPDRLDPWLAGLMDEDRKRELTHPPVVWRGTDQNRSVAPDEECFPAIPLAA